jgi:hypothetical protein
MSDEQLELEIARHAALRADLHKPYDRAVPRQMERVAAAAPACGTPEHRRPVRRGDSQLRLEEPGLVAQELGLLLAVDEEEGHDPLVPLPPGDPRGR